MAKTKISEFSSTPANNTDIDSINIAEGCAPSGINDAIRELMAQLKDFQTGAQGDSFNGPIGTSTAAAGAFTTLSATGAITSTLATGSAPLVIASTTKVANLNVDLLDGADWASPAALGSTTPAAGSFTTLGASSTATLNTLVSSGATLTGGTINGMTIGATTASTGAFTTLAASSSVTLSGGTANGVTYLNGSKVLTSGSALTFDGTNFVVGGAYTSGYKLQSYAASGNQGISIVNGSNTAGDYAAFSFIQGGTNTATFYTNSSNLTINANTGASIFQIGGSEQMRLTSTGLGIGTSSPSFKLDVRQSTDGTVGYFRRIGGTANPALKLVANETGNTVGFDTDYSSSSPDYTWSIGGTSVMRLTSSGNLGLGVTPSASTVKAFQVPTSTVIGSQGTGLNITSNAYFDSAFKYHTTGAATWYQQASGQHAWWNAGSGTAGNAISFTQAMTLDADGDLGIGSTSPSKALDIRRGSGVGAALSLAGNGTTVDSTNFELSQASDSVCYVFNRSNTSLIFGTNNTERARIDSSGNLLVGDTTSGTVRLRVTNSASDDIALFKNSNATPYGVNVVFSGASPNNTTSYFYTCADSGPTTRFKVYSNGGIANYSANNVNLSDQRVKTEIQDAGGYLAKICAIPVRTFKYKDQTDDLPNLGVIAQEVEAVAPELVDTTGFGEMPEDGVPLKAIYQTDLQYALMKALQELKAEFDAYKASHP